jgi:molecular chaperone DnaJ
MTRKEALQIVHLDSGATPEDVKKAYRALAFSLHPDLNPDNPDAGKAFQRLNEAYVCLTAAESRAGTAADAVRNRGQRRGTPAREHKEGPKKGREEGRKEASEKARADAFSAYEKAGKRFRDAANGMRGAAPDNASARPDNGRGKDRDEVLRDLLRDPFARRVFEDIYSQIRQDAERKSPPPPGAGGRNGKAGTAASRRTQAHTEPGVIEKTAENVSAWLRRQIDEEQTVRFAGRLSPGKRIRLQIEHGLFGKSQTIELTLPPEFEPGKPVRLKGLGKQIGKWKGDLYLKILGSTS